MALRAGLIAESWGTAFTFAAVGCVGLAINHAVLCESNRCLGTSGYEPTPSTDEVAGNDGAEDKDVETVCNRSPLLALSVSVSVLVSVCVSRTRCRLTHCHLLLQKDMDTARAEREGLLADETSGDDTDDEKRKGSEKARD